MTMQNYDQMTAQSIAVLDAFARALALATIRGDVTREVGSHICQEAEALFDQNWDPSMPDDVARASAEAKSEAGAILASLMEKGIQVEVVLDGEQPGSGGVGLPDGEGLGSQKED